MCTSPLQREPQVSRDVLLDLRLLLNGQKPVDSATLEAGGSLEHPEAVAARPVARLLPSGVHAAQSR